LRGQRQFKGTGCPDQIDAGFCHAVAAQGVHRAIDQVLDDEAVEPRRDQGKAGVLKRGEVAFNGSGVCIADIRG
jgi:hypothetical protein